MHTQPLPSGAVRAGSEHRPAAMSMNAPAVRHRPAWRGKCGPQIARWRRAAAAAALGSTLFERGTRNLDVMMMTVCRRAALMRVKNYHIARRTRAVVARRRRTQGAPPSTERCIATGCCHYSSPQQLRARGEADGIEAGGPEAGGPYGRQIPMVRNALRGPPGNPVAKARRASVGSIRRALRNLKCIRLV